VGALKCLFLGAMEELVIRKRLLEKSLPYFMTKLPGSKVNRHSFGPADSPVYLSLKCHCCSMKMVTLRVLVLALLIYCLFICYNQHFIN